VAFNDILVEQIARWCMTDISLTDIRSKARNEFFGYDEPGEIKYLEGTGDEVGQERRFMGWFALTYRLSAGSLPAVRAAAEFLKGDELLDAITAVWATRYVLAIE